MSYPDQTVYPDRRSSQNVALPPGHNGRVALGDIPASSPNTSIAINKSNRGRALNSVITKFLAGTVCLLMLHIAELRQVATEPIEGEFSSIETSQMHFAELDSHRLDPHPSACGYVVETWSDKHSRTP